MHTIRGLNIPFSMTMQVQGFNQYISLLDIIYCRKDGDEKVSLSLTS